MKSKTGIIEKREGISRAVWIGAIVIIAVIVIGAVAYIYMQPSAVIEINGLTHTYPIVLEYNKIMREIDEELGLNYIAEEAVSTDQLTEKIRLYMAAESTDVDFLWADDMKLPEWIAAGWAEPLDDYLEKFWDEYDLDDIPESLWDALSYDGKIYGIPFLFNTRVLFYRTDLFEAKGLTAPETFDEWLEAAEILTEDDRYGAAFAIKDYDSASFTFSEMLWSHGGEYLDEDYNPIFNGTEGVEALETLKELLPYCPPGTITYTTDEVMVDMQQGFVASGILWATRCAQMDNPETSTVVDKIEFEIAPAKAGYDGTVWAPVDCFWVSAYGEHKEETVELILGTLTDEYQKELVPFGLVPKGSVLQDPAVAQEYRWIPKCLEAAKNGKSLSNIPESVAMFEKLKEEIHKALMDEKTPKEALDATAEWYYDFLEEKGYYD